MKITVFFLICAGAISAFAHKPGFYKIDGKDDALAHFAVVKPCTAAKDALKGKLRAFTFSDLATNETYKFKSGFYVEIHDEKNEEIYVKTDYNCVPSKDGVRLPATGKTLAGFAIQRLE